MCMYNIIPGASMLFWRITVDVFAICNLWRVGSTKITCISSYRWVAWCHCGLPLGMCPSQINSRFTLNECNHIGMSPSERYPMCLNEPEWFIASMIAFACYHQRRLVLCFLRSLSYLIRLNRDRWSSHSIVADNQGMARGFRVYRLRLFSARSLGQVTRLGWIMSCFKEFFYVCGWAEPIWNTVWQAKETAADSMKWYHTLLHSKHQMKMREVILWR